MPTQPVRPMNPYQTLAVGIEVGCYQIRLSYGFFASCLWTRFYGRLELRGLTSREGQQFNCSWTRRRWEAARNDYRVGRQHSVWAMCPGDRGGSDEMLSVRHQRAVLAKPRIEFQISSVRSVTKFRCSGTSATWCDTSNVINRDAFSSAST